MRPALPGQRVVALAFDQADQALVQIERRDEQFFHARITGEPGEGVEDDRDFLGDLRIGREQTEVGVDARGARMIIAGAEMHIMPEPIGIAPDDEERFAMRLQTDHAVNDMRARFLQPARPLNVGRFVEARAQFDQRGHLFAGVGRVDQRLDDRRIAAGAVKRDLDCENLRILRGSSRSIRRSGRNFRRDDAGARPVCASLRK